MNTCCVIVMSREKCWAKAVNRITILRSGQQGSMVRLPTATINFNPKRPEELPSHVASRSVGISAISLT